MRLTNCNCLTTSAAAITKAPAEEEEEVETKQKHKLCNKTFITNKDCKTHKTTTKTQAQFTIKTKSLKTCKKSLLMTANTKTTQPAQTTTTIETASSSCCSITTQQTNPRIPTATTLIEPTTNKTTTLTANSLRCHCSFNLKQMLWWRHQRRWHSLTATLILFCLSTIIQSSPALNIQNSRSDIYKNLRLGHRIVQTRYGRLHGLILPLDNYRFLRSVEVFLGVPYATPPTKQNR